MAALKSQLQQEKLQLAVEARCVAALHQQQHISLVGVTGTSGNPQEAVLHACHC